MELQAALESDAALTSPVPLQAWEETVIAQVQSSSLGHSTGVILKPSPESVFFHSFSAASKPLAHISAGSCSDSYWYQAERPSDKVQAALHESTT